MIANGICYDWKREVGSSGWFCGQQAVGNGILNRGIGTARAKKGARIRWPKLTTPLMLGFFWNKAEPVIDIGGYGMSVLFFFLFYRREVEKRFMRKLLAEVEELMDCRSTLV